MVILVGDSILADAQQMECGFDCSNHKSPCNTKLALKRWTELQRQHNPQKSTVWQVNGSVHLAEVVLILEARTQYTNLGLIDKRAHNSSGSIFFVNFLASSIAINSLGLQMTLRKSVEHVAQATHTSSAGMPWLMPVVHTCESLLILRNEACFMAEWGRALASSI